jgi:hypothetical protein
VSETPYLPRPCFERGKPTEKRVMKLLVSVAVFAGALSFLLADGSRALGYL